jgi:type IV pilus assembly protein PilY1
MANQVQFCKKFIVSDGFEVCNMKQLISNLRRERMVALLTAAGLTMMMTAPIPLFASAPPAVPISQLPLTIAIPAHPQIMIAVANSESMDGNLSGAIMAGSGSLGSNFTNLNPSSSPVNFAIPTGFTPPVDPGSGGFAPYTVSVSGNRVDNSPSRLNVAKAGISAILDQFMASADFGLLTYSTSGTTLYNTWVYQMSPPGGFTFTSVAAPTGQVANPCYGINVANSDAVSQSCNGINAHYPLQNITAQPYMNIGSSSDDPSINDVLYAGGGISAVCLAFTGPSPVNPYPPNYSLANFNAGGFSVHEAYSNGVNGCALDTGPTNAGFVPFSTEVIYEQRGFGYGANQDPGTAAIPVQMKTAGATPTAGSVTTALNFFLPLLQPETDRGTPEIKALAGQSPMAGLMSGALNYYTTVNPSSSNGCTPHRYVILVTDGLPTFDLAGRSWPPLGSAAALGYGVSATFDPINHGLVSTNDQALTDVINQLNALNSAGIQTYIVGLGAGVNPSLNPAAAATLTAMAVAGGTGDYFAATDPTALTNDLQSILATILAATQSVASVAVNSTGLSTNTVVYQSQFVASDTDQDWTGNLFAFPANPTSGVVDTNPADAVWDAASKLDAQNPMTGRKIATWDPVTGTGIPFEWNSASPPSGIANSTLLGQDLTTFMADPNGQDVLQYLRGDKTLEKQNGGQFRNRTHILGDIIFSNPTYVAGPATFNLSSSYLAFAAAHAHRSPVIYVGANDGMLHAFDATSGNATSGSELFAYIPRGVYGNLINLASPFYNGRHLFYVDGSPQVADVQFADSTWHSVLFGNEGAGGKSIFAIDVTDPATIVSEATLASHVLWDFTHIDMGLGFANPVLANTNSGTLLFVGNGYDSINEKPFLYALNPQTGVTFSKVDLCAAVPTACNLAVANGLSTPVVVNTSGQSTASANMVYAGDLQGNLWRIDISDPVPTNWTVSVLLQARGPGGVPQPITTPPTVTLNPRYPQLAGTMVFVGTGQLLGLPDLGNTSVQSIYGVYDPPGGYATPLMPGRAPAASDLVQQFLTSATIGGVNVATVTNNAVSLPTTKGWFIDLTLNSGERVVNPPQLRSGTIIVTSTVPAPNSCSQGGLSFSYFINFANGSAFTTPQFDVNGDHLLNQSDMVHNADGSYTPPVAVETGVGFYAAATLENTNGNMPTGILVYNCPASGSLVCTPRYMKGAISHRVSWWEVRQ